MKSLTYSEARANLATTMDKAIEDHEPVIISRSGKKRVVLVSLEDYNSMEETAYLLRSPSNASRLLESLAQANDGNFIDVDLDL